MTGWHQGRWTRRLENRNSQTCMGERNLEYGEEILRDLEPYRVGWEDIRSTVEERKDWPYSSVNSGRQRFGEKYNIPVKLAILTLTGVAQWIGHAPSNQNVAGSIPSQGTCLGGRGPPVCGCARGNQPMFLSLSFSLPSPLSKNKFKIFSKIEILVSFSIFTNQISVKVPCWVSLWWRNRWPQVLFFSKSHSSKVRASVKRQLLGRT